MGASRVSVQLRAATMCKTTYNKVQHLIVSAVGCRGDGVARSRRIVFCCVDVNFIASRAPAAHRGWRGPEQTSK